MTNRENKAFLEVLIFTDEEIEILLGESKLAGVKLIKEKTSLGLKDSKDLFEYIVENRFVLSPLLKGIKTQLGENIQVLKLIQIKTKTFVVIKKDQIESVFVFYKNEYNSNFWLECFDLNDLKSVIFELIKT